MKVILDTNVLVSGTFWTGNSFRILNLIDKNELSNITSKEIIKEYYEVVNSDEIIDKIEDKKLKMLKIAHKVINNSEIVEPSVKIDIIKDDPDDNKILECAIAGNVDCIVSNDKHLLKLKKFRNIPILTPDDFAEKYFDK